MSEELKVIKKKGKAVLLDLPAAIKRLLEEVRIEWVDAVYMDSDEFSSEGIKALGEWMKEKKYEQPVPTYFREETLRKIMSEGIDIRHLDVSTMVPGAKTVICGLELIADGKGNVEATEMHSTELMKAVFGNPGGKGMLAHKIVPYIPEHNTYIEPFCGAASVFFTKKDSNKAVLNDMNENTVAMYHFMMKATDQDISRIQHRFKTVPTREQFIKLRNKIGENNIQPNWEGFSDYYLLTYYSYGLNRDTYSYKTTKSIAYTRIPKAKAKLLENNTIITQGDAIECVKRWDAPDAFFYIDPPYPKMWPRSRIKADRPYTYKDFENLMDTLRGIKGKFLLSMGKRPELDKIINKYPFKKKGVLRAVTSFDGKKTNDDRNIEWLIYNYEIPENHPFTLEDNHEIADARDDVIILQDRYAENSDYHLALIRRTVELEDKPLLYSEIVRALEDETGKWNQYTLQHHYIGDGTVHTDLRLKTKSGNFGFTLFTPGKGTDKIGKDIDSSVRFVVKPGKFGDEWFIANDVIKEGSPGTANKGDAAIIIVDKGRYRVADVDSNSLKFQVKGIGYQVDKRPLEQLKVKDRSPDTMKGLSGFYKLWKANIDGEDVPLLKKLDSVESTNEVEAWIDSLLMKSILTRSQMTQIVDYFETEEITSMTEISKRVNISKVTANKYAKLLGYYPM